MQRLDRWRCQNRRVEADERWYESLEAVGAVRGDGEQAFATLSRAYAQGDRHFHVIAHASDVVDGVLGLRSSGDDWATVVLAAWYHDAVYDPRAPFGANEGCSAVMAERELSRLGAARSAIAEVVRLICTTVHHDPVAGDRNGALLSDADLSTLAGDADLYDRYSAAIRAEYAWVDDEAWSAGRRALLRGLLDRPAIFRTLTGRERFEARARINISSELANLRP